MAKVNNPFPISGYIGPSYFCNRERERADLVNACENGRNITLIAPRRMGKSGLIHHTFYQLRKQGWVCIYIDLLNTYHFGAMVQALANGVFNALPRSKGNWIERLMSALARVRPVLKVDQVSGMPQLELTLEGQVEKEHALTDLMAYLAGFDVPIVLAIDEFQQVAHYPEKGTEALLRSVVQQHPLLRFIFSGSHARLMAEMFVSAKRPFFQSTQLYSLGPLDPEEYAGFIVRQFRKRDRQISKKAADWIVAWCRNHTYYVQYLANRLFATGQEENGISEVQQVCMQLLQEKQAEYVMYQKMLTSHQFGLLVAIAKEEKVYHPTAQEFIRKHKLSSHATVRKGLDVLVEQEVVYEVAGQEDTYYQVYDVFLSRWLQTVR